MRDYLALFDLVKKLNSCRGTAPGVDAVKRIVADTGVRVSKLSDFFRATQNEM